MAKIIKTLTTMLAAIMATGIVSSCQKADNRYSDFAAHFAYQPVSAKPTLHRACTSLGQFCTITHPVGQNYVVKSPSTPTITDYIPRTALHDYQRFVLGLGGGLIVGMPILPEMLDNENQVTCYDLCCPNCYQNYHILKHMQLHSAGTATCPSCQRTYDLNNQGIITMGEPGRSLFRYYTHYYSPTQKLTINNR